MSRGPFFSVLLVLLITAASTIATPAHAALQPQDLRFIPSSSADITSYRVEATDQASRQIFIFNFDNSFALDAEGVATLQVLLEEAATYSVVLVATDGNGLESVPSNSIIVVVAAVPPASSGCSTDSDCADADLCNGTETCSNGACVVGTPLVCADAGACQLGSCDPGFGCVLEAVPDGGQCNDNNAQTMNDVCTAGACAGVVPECFDHSACSDGDVCSGVERCVNNQCLAALPAADGMQCDDGTSETIRDQCTQGTCAGVVPECSADTDCGERNLCAGAATCLNHFCVVQPAPADGTACDDGNPETLSDQCVAKICRGTTPLCVTDADCSDGEPCNGDETCVGNACATGPPLDDGTSCDDGNAGTNDDQCSMQACSGKPQVAMDVAIVATVDGDTLGASLAGETAALHEGAIPGEARPVSCDLDGDGLQEIVVGQGRGSRGRVLIHRISADGVLTSTEVLRAGFRYYNRRNGETRPACGDFDGDGRDELFVGFGAQAWGFVQVFDDATTSFSPLRGTYRNRGFIRMPDRSGTQPVAGDIDGDGRSELVLAFDGDSSGLYLLDDATHRFAPISEGRVFEGRLDLAAVLMDRVDSGARLYPTLGDPDGDGVDELLTGFGSGGRGVVLLLGALAEGFGDAVWIRASDSAYAKADGQAHPSLGDLDGDGRDELVIGFGPSAGTSLLVLDDATSDFSDFPGLPEGELDLGGEPPTGPIRPCIR